MIRMVVLINLFRASTRQGVVCFVAWFVAAASMVSTQDVETIPGIDQSSRELFLAGKYFFQKEWVEQEGLGPTFNARSCIACHKLPRIGGFGGSENAVLLAAARTNDAFDNLGRYGGPIFQRHSIEGVPIKAVPEQANIRSTRVPPPLFGLGLIEEIPDAEILALAGPLDSHNRAGIRGRANLVGGKVGRFGAKAQVSSLFDFMVEAASTEIGLRSPFKSGEDVVAGDSKYSLPSDPEINAQVVFRLMYFVKFLAPPSPKARGRLEVQGQTLFHQIGCDGCHVSTLMTGRNTARAFDRVPVTLYSDLLLHNMGDELADGFEQGLAAGQDFRTTPLWGLGAREHFLHDGRSLTIDDAIRHHGGEATTTEQKYEWLDSQSKGMLVAFLRSL
jgi:CxxC motif-containing protein (DUF1111 family)